MLCSIDFHYAMLGHGILYSIYRMCRPRKAANFCSIQGMRGKIRRGSMSGDPRDRETAGASDVWDMLGSTKVESSEKWLIKATCFGGEFLPFSQLRWILIWMILFRYHLDYDYIYIYIWCDLPIFWSVSVMKSIDVEHLHVFPLTPSPNFPGCVQVPMLFFNAESGRWALQGLVGGLGDSSHHPHGWRGRPWGKFHITWMDDIEVVSTILSPAWPLLVTFQHSFRHSK